MIQSAQVASKFTLFTHHAKTFPNLITALRNSMLRAGVFKDEKTAEEQVVQVLNFNIHLVKDFRGRRYIERITECIPVEEKNEYTFDHRKEKTLEGKLDKFFDNAAIFFSKTTNRELYKYHNVLEFSDDSYVLTNPITETNIREMRNNMDEGDVVKFDQFLERVWGIKPPKKEEYEYVEEELGSEKKEEIKPDKENEKIIETSTKPVEEKSEEQKRAEMQARKEAILKQRAAQARMASKMSAREVNMRRQAAEAARRATQNAQKTKEENDKKDKE